MTTAPVHSITDEQIAEIEQRASMGLSHYVHGVSSYAVISLIARLREAEKDAAQQWISVNERLPMEPDGCVTFEAITVLACNDFGTVNTAEFARGGGHIGKPWACWSDYSQIKPSRITHWMPLPSPPTAMQEHNK